MRSSGRFALPCGRRHVTGTGLQKWYGYLKTDDRAALWDLLHPDAVFESPVVHTPQRGRDITFKYLSSAGKVLGGPGFTYVGEWKNADGAVLEFKSTLQWDVVAKQPNKALRKSCLKPSPAS